MRTLAVTALALAAVARLSAATPMAPPTHQLSKRIPDVLWGSGAFSFTAQGTPIIVLDNNVQASYQIADGNFVVYKDNQPQWNSGVSEPGCTPPHTCTLVFQDDGNLVSYYDGVPTWFTSTAGVGRWLAFFDIEPYIVIYDASNDPVWHTPITVATPPPPSSGGGNPCGQRGIKNGQCGGYPPGPPSYYGYHYTYPFKRRDDE